MAAVGAIDAVHAGERNRELEPTPEHEELRS